jgi:hypothetical protein
VYERLPERGNAPVQHTFVSFAEGHSKKTDTSPAKHGNCIRIRVCLGENFTVKKLSGRFDAVLIATGAWKEKLRSLKATPQFIPA